MNSMQEIVNLDQIEYRKKESRKLLTELMLALLIFLSMVSLEFILGPSLYISIFSFVIFFGMIIRIVLLDTVFFILMFLILFGHIGAAASMLIIENGAYMGEIQKHGFPIGALSKQVFYVTLFTLGVYFPFYFIFNKKLLLIDDGQIMKDSKLFNFIFLILFYTIILVLLGVVAKYGSPLWLGVDRMVFWTKIAPSWTEYVHSTMPQLSCISGVIYAKSNNKLLKKILLFTFIITLMTSFLHGEKSSKLILTSYFFFTPILVGKFQFKNLILNWRMVLLPVIIVSILGGSIFLNYTLIKGSEEIALLVLEARLALQGQVFWAVDNFVSFEVKSLDFFVSNVFGIGNENKDTIGLYYLMNLISPIRALEYFLDGVTFTYGFPSILLLGCGYILGVPVIFLCGLILSVVLFYFAVFLLRKDSIFILVAVKLFFVCYLAFVMGAMVLFASFKIYLFLFITVVVKVIKDVHFIQKK